MNKLDQEEIEVILKNTDSLESKLDWLGDAATELRKVSNLPDFEELQKYDDTAKVGYLVEDIETCLANIDQEISDATNKVSDLRAVLIRLKRKI